MKKITRTKDSLFCTLEVELKDGRLSICGTSGIILTSSAAKREAFQYWESFFEAEDTELARMRREFGKTTPKSAAKYVLQEDGEFYGLDVDREVDGHVYLAQSGGQITDTLKEFFPEVEPYLKWHLNDMHSECEHQEQRGEKWSTHPSAKCQDCGYVLGSACTKRELPQDVITWFNGLAS